MRQLFQEQLPLTGPVVQHSHAEELQRIDRILKDNSGITELVLQDLQGGSSVGGGREGMSAEQVLRTAIIKQINTFSYEELSFRLADSWTYGRFCGFGCLEPVPARSTLQRNVKAVTAATWEAINHILLGYARQEKIEDGRKVRIDGTVVAANIHPPTDSSLLWDSVRVLARLLTRAREQCFITHFPNRCRRAKRRAIDVLNAKNKRTRTKGYRDLLIVTKETVGYARAALVELEARADLTATRLKVEIEHYLPLIECVIEQTERRVLHGETVPAEDKLFSIFEPHSDIIIKDRRDTYYGHKLTVTGGRSGLILDWVVEEGNPADSTLALRMLERQKEIYGLAPRQAALDGAYASKANLAAGKLLGVKDLAFSKKRGLAVLDMATSERVYKRLRNFRAGIESWISFLKRALGLDRCTWRGWAGFAHYVGASIVAANLLTLARQLK
jgi:transposase, IS5 family